MVNKNNIRFKRTKIIATLGPSSTKAEIIEELILSGADVFRINFSHGTLDDHEQTIKKVRKVSEKLDLNIGILGDLQGPKIRTNEVENNGIPVKESEIIILTAGKEIGTKGHITTTYKTISEDVNKGDPILIDDGNIELVVDDVKGKEVHCKVLHGGTIKSRKGINLPATKVSVPALTKKDKKDLQFALQQNLDWIALSFVRHENDVIELRKIINDYGSKMRIISKIEKPEAIDRLNHIIKQTNAIMVARGDLGVEIPLQGVPMLQKKIVNQCNQRAVPVIIATQMLESMINSPRPTRAEANDVANAVLDGADVVMLSGETAAGNFPVHAVKIMEDTIGKAEEESLYDYDRKKPVKISHKDATYINDHMISMASRLSSSCDAEAIVGITQSGYTAFKLAAYRPSSRIIIFSSNKQTLTMLGLIWGVTTFYYEAKKSTDETIKDIESILKEKKILFPGDIYVTLGSMPVSEGLRTNMAKISVTS